MPNPADIALRKSAAGLALSSDDADALTHLGADALDVLCETAAGLRDRFHTRVLTYSPKVFLPVTNLCRDRCTYCTFRRDPEDPGVWTMSPDEIADWSRRGRDVGCTEALMCLGDKPEIAFRGFYRVLEGYGVATTAEYVGKACEIALAEGLLPHTNAGLLSKAEMAALRPLNVSMGLMLENVSQRAAVGEVSADGVVTRYGAGPGLVLSFVLLGAVCALAGLCYAELTALIPMAGSAYTYAYATLGELVAWIIGLDLILEYAVGAVNVAIGWSGYVVSFLADVGVHIPAQFSAARGTIITMADGTTVTALFNLPAVVIIFVVTVLLVVGVKESASFNNVIVFVKLAVILLFLLAASLPPFRPVKNRVATLKLSRRHCCWPGFFVR